MKIRASLGEIKRRGEKRASEKNFRQKHPCIFVAYFQKRTLCFAPLDELLYCFRV